MSSPAVIFGSLLLPSIWADPPFHWASEPVERLQTLRVLRMGGRPSHLIFVELPKGEVRRIPIPRTRVNKDKKRGSEPDSSPDPSDPSHGASKLPRTLLQATRRRILVLSSWTLARRSSIRVTIPVTFGNRREGHAGERHAKCHHDRRDQQRNALPHLLTSFLLSPKQNRHTSLGEIAGCATGSTRPSFSAHL